MNLEQIPEDPNSRRSDAPLARPRAGAGAVIGVFWDEREMRAVWRLIIFFMLFAGITAVGIFAAISLRLPLAMRAGEIAAPGLLVQEAVQLLAALLAALIMAKLEGRPFGAYGLPGASAFGARFWQGTAWGLAMISAVMLLIRLPGGYSTEGLALQGPEILKFGTLWGVVFLCVGFFEEFFFRGYAQFTLASSMKFWPAATMLSAVFGAIHLGNGGEDRIGAVSVFVIGMFFCLTLRRTGSLWFAVGLHAAFDWGETFLYSTPDSGVVAPGHLLNSSFHGAAWLTGGTVGPEGSVMAFVVVGAAALLFSRLYPPREESSTGFSL